MSRPVYITVYCTHAPCLACSGLLINAGVARVVYRMSYRSDDGLEWPR